MPDLLTFARLRDANVRRMAIFRNRRGEYSHNADGSNWSLAEWLCAVCGEAGEAANVAKKIIRGDFGPDVPGNDDRSRALHDLATELADVVIYSDLACYRTGHDLAAMVREKFNVVSGRIGCEIELNGETEPDNGTYEMKLRHDASRITKRAIVFRLKAIAERFQMQHPYGSLNYGNIAADLNELIRELQD